MYSYFNDCLVFVLRTRILSLAHKYVHANNMAVNRYTCVDLFMDHIINYQWYTNLLHAPTANNKSGTSRTIASSTRKMRPGVHQDEQQDCDGVG